MNEDDLVRLPDSLDAINDHFYEKGWTDGLPIIPPTEGRIATMLRGMGWRDGDELIGDVPPGGGRATLRKISVNAVMAGCKPEYLPVVVAALEATLEPRYGLHHRQTTTHAAAPMIIVNGPIVGALKINYGNGCFGPGWRANATIGRALRLCHMNLGDAIPAIAGLAQHSHPGKYTYCIAEHEAANPWEPLHVGRGFDLKQSVVTVVQCEAPHSMTKNVRIAPLEIMDTFASSMAALGGNNVYSQGEPAVVLGIEHVAHFHAGGWSKADFKQHVFEMARQPWGKMKNRGKSKGPFFPDCVDKTDDTSMVPIINDPNDLVVVVAGGAGGKSMWCPTAGAQTLSASKSIDLGPNA